MISTSAIRICCVIAEVRRRAGGQAAARRPSAWTRRSGLTGSARADLEVGRSVARRGAARYAWLGHGRRYLRRHRAGRRRHAHASSTSATSRSTSCGSSPRPARPGGTITWEGTRHHGRGRRHRRLRAGSTSRCSRPARPRRSRSRRAGRGGRRRRDRQLLGVADGPRRPARGRRGQRARRASTGPRASSPTRTARRWPPSRCSAPLTGRPGSRPWSSAPTRRSRAAGWPASPSSTSRSRKVADRRAELTFDGRAVEFPRSHGVPPHRSPST